MKGRAAFGTAAPWNRRTWCSLVGRSDAPVRILLFDHPSERLIVEGMTEVTRVNDTDLAETISKLPKQDSGNSLPGELLHLGGLRVDTYE